MKKLSVILLSLLLVFALASCTASPETPSDGADTVNSNTVKESIYTFKAEAAGNFEIKIDQNMAEVLNALGEPLSYFEAASCAFDGLDKTYTYAGFIVSTRPDGDQDFVNSVRLTDDSVTTPEGLYVGSAAEAVVAAYGEAAEQTDTLLRYVNGNTALNFTLENGTVISIEYLLAE